MLHHGERKGVPEKHKCFIDYVKPFGHADHNKLENALGDDSTRPPYLSPEKPVCRSRSNGQNKTEKLTSFKLGYEYNTVVYCYPAYLTYMQSTSCKKPGWMKHKLESRLLGEISITSRYTADMTLMAESEDTPIIAESEEELKILLVKVKEES